MSIPFRALLLLALPIALTVAACGPAPTYSPEDVATMVAATVEGLGELPHEIASASPESTSAAEATPIPTTSAPPVLHVAYTDGGNVAYYVDPGPAVLLTSSGSVESVRVSDDGERIAYTRRPSLDDPVELRLINADGSGDTQLMGPADFDALYPLGGALHHDLFQFDFLPGTHLLLFNTRSTFEGPGLAKHDDLIRIDTDSLGRTMLLAPGSGGDFIASSNGQYLAITRPDTIEILRADGTSTGSGVINYPPVITYSEYAYYAQPVWAPDSMSIGAAIPSSDPLAPSTTGSVWRLPVGGSASLVTTIPGQFFLFGTGSEPLLSPDLSLVAYTRPTTAPNIWALFVASSNGTAENLIASADLAWAGWSPDSLHFLFSLGAPLNLQLGDLSGASTALVTGTGLQWFNPAEFVFLAGSAGAWSLQRDGIGTAGSTLATPAGDFVDYDLAYD